MDQRPEWFAQKRFGYGAGLPISWQGWVILLVYLAIVIGGARLLHDRPLALIGVILPATAALIVTTARTTRGGWQWRWGRRDRD